jgi:ABC-type multidrug transport system ATPase subunit
VTLPGKKQVGPDGKRLRLELLKGITGIATPGQLTALMGGSGAGKARPISLLIHRLIYSKLEKKSTGKNKQQKPCAGPRP